MMLSSAVPRKPVCTPFWNIILPCSKGAVVARLGVPVCKVGTVTAPASRRFEGQRSGHLLGQGLGRVLKSQDKVPLV